MHAKTHCPNSILPKHPRNVAKTSYLVAQISVTQMVCCWTVWQPLDQCADV